VASPLTQKLLHRFYDGVPHPYRVLEDEVKSKLTGESVFVDAGCGHSAELGLNVCKYARWTLGVDSVGFDAQAVRNLTCIRADLQRLPLADRSVDLVAARSVMEHIDDPLAVYREVQRVLRPGGYFVFLTPSSWDYATIIAKLVPNRYHGKLVRLTEGRAEVDTFPTFYRSNTIRAINALARKSGFALEREACLGQYPSYLMFNPVLFLLGTAYDRIVTRFDLLQQLRGWLLVTLRKEAKSLSS
jgi:SAM-dependent methyltransferase